MSSNSNHNTCSDFIPTEPWALYECKRIKLTLLIKSGSTFSGRVPPMLKKSDQLFHWQNSTMSNPDFGYTSKQVILAKTLIRQRERSHLPLQVTSSLIYCTTNKPNIAKHNESNKSSFRTQKSNEKLVSQPHNLLNHLIKANQLRHQKPKEIKPEGKQQEENKQTLAKYLLILVGSECNCETQISLWSSPNYIGIQIPQVQW